MAKRFDKRQVDELMLAFGQSENLSKAKKLELSRITGLDMEQVTGWFNRTRARKRERELVRNLKQINAVLRRSLKECQEREAKLQKDLEESKTREAEAGTENQNLKRLMKIVEGNEFCRMILFRESSALSDLLYN